MTENTISSPASVESLSTDTAIATPLIDAKVDAKKVQIWRIIIFAALLAFVWLLAVVLYRQNTSGQRAAGGAPNFEITTFDGQIVRLADLRGKGVVLNFWASWCVPCRNEAKLLEATWQREKDNNIVFIGIDYLDQDHKAKAFLQEFGISYQNAPDLQSKVSRSYGITGVPETFFIAPDGTIKATMLAEIQTQQQLDEQLAKIR